MLDTLPKTNSSHLKMDGWNTTFLLEWPIFRCYVSVDFWGVDVRYAIPFHFHHSSVSLPQNASHFWHKKIGPLHLENEQLDFVRVALHTHRELMIYINEIL